MDTISFLPSFLKMLCALTIVIGIMVGAMYFFKRALQQTTAGVDTSQAINIVASRYLGPRSSIILLEILGRVIVIGICNNQMSLLTTISDADAMGRISDMQRQERRLPPIIDYLKCSKLVMEKLGRPRKGNPK
jgi:flagellar protein FliO/FliZ